MCKRRPKDLAEYRRYLKETHGVDLAPAQTHYEAVSSRMRQNAIESRFWRALGPTLPEWNDEYAIRTQYPLLSSLKEPPILIKTFDSFLLKTYRKNVLNNDEWPEPPQEGWVLPSNWFSRINDVIRCMIVVKYLDGVRFIVERLVNICGNSGCEHEVSYEAREEGYYAAHFLAIHESEIPGISWDTKRIQAVLEIQITTQLQEVIRRLLHKYYGQRRESLEEPEIDWKWDHGSDEFAANYLGHILHYVEGMIVEIRKTQKRGER